MLRSLVHHAFAVEPLAFCRDCHAPERTAAGGPDPTREALGIACVTCHDPAGRGEWRVFRAEAEKVSTSTDLVFSLLQQLNAMLEPKARQQLAENLIVNVYALGLAAERGAVPREDISALSQAADALLPRVAADLEGLADDIELRFVLSFEPGDWVDLLQLRSGLEFLFEVFPGRAAPCVREVVASAA